MKKQFIPVVTFHRIKNYCHFIFWSVSATEISNWPFFHLIVKLIQCILNIYCVIFVTVPNVTNTISSRYLIQLQIGVS